MTELQYITKLNRLTTELSEELNISIEAWNIWSESMKKFNKITVELKELEAEIRQTLLTK